MSVANLVASADARGRVGLPVLDGRYVATARLGRGASGSTWAAEDVARGDRCVVKLFGAGAGAEIAGEFRRLASLAHPSVVRVRDVGRAADGRAFLVTDLVGGPGLDVVAAIVDDTDRVRRFERLARDLADALAYLHARGLVHGDVAAANVRFAADGRAVLLDLGLAGAPRDGVGGARGTLGYAPPEALVGVRGVAGDLFGLGATLFEAWTGAPPFGHGLAAVQRMLTTRAPRLSAVRAGLPPAWDDLGAALLASEAAQRPASARDVLRLVARASHDGTPSLGDFSAPFPEGDPLEGVFVGRAAERETLRRALEPLAEGAAPRAAIAVVGAPGSGRRTLIESVVREVALAAAAGVTTEVHVARGEVEVLEALVGVAGSAVAEADEARREQRRFAALAEALERSAASRPLCAVLPESSLSEAFLSFMAGAPPSGRIVIVAPTTAPVARPFVENVVLAPLGDEAVRALVARAAWGEDVPSEAADAIVAAAGGHAALAAALARRLALAVREKSALDPTALARPGDDLTAVLAAGFAALSEEARATVVALSLTSNVEAARAIAGLDEVSWSSAFAAARREGWVRAPGVGEGLTSPAHAAIAREALREPAFALT
ncbi:MAG TPA: serine/threonine-protein kinase, partial [Polyangia bacterium]|nr:serine/threonine-protein kinase [Polyangia bacterium]